MLISECLPFESTMILLKAEYKFSCVFAPDTNNDDIPVLHEENLSALLLSFDVSVLPWHQQLDQQSIQLGVACPELVFWFCKLVLQALFVSQPSIRRQTWSNK